MNGPTYSINLREPIAWDRFKELPQDLQKTYLDNIFKQFKIGPSSLARMFGISNQYCGKHMRALGYTFSTRASRKDEERFEAAYCVQKKETTTTSTASVNTSTGIQLTTVTLTGAFSAEGVAAALAKLFTEGQNVAITASISN